eukprot:5048398-Prymnesium_polylepis.1
MCSTDRGATTRCGICEAHWHYLHLGHRRRSFEGDSAKAGQRATLHSSCQHACGFSAIATQVRGDGIAAQVNSHKLRAAPEQGDKLVDERAAQSADVVGS